MIVTFVSECQKKAHLRTRRVLDAFANRIGTNTWQTVITAEGLNAVYKLLKKTASKNTAVSCHKIHSRKLTKLLWVVGNKSKFNSTGIVAVNYTNQDISQFMDKYKWKTIEVIKYASTIAGLFHDYGKANKLFQNKLNPEIPTPLYEPYRHEWISLRLFQAFVGYKKDSEWIKELSQIEKNIEFPEYFKDGVSSGSNHPMKELPPMAKLIAWLILTHHRLPIYPSWKETNPPELKYIDEWFNNLGANWNSHNCKDEEQKERISENWQCNLIPIKSLKWCCHSGILTSEAIPKLQQWIVQDNNWLDDQLFTTHLSRLCLMLGDHFYSGSDIKTEYRSGNYDAWANTDRKTKEYKQKLDEHLIGVALHIKNIAEALPKLNSSLKSLTESYRITEKVSQDLKEKFGWQDDARKLATKVGRSTIEQGFFGINMASTGKGKTLANAKIMTALGDETKRIRFSIALGLRTLTLQTGREYRDKLALNREELAIMVGGLAVKQLFENEQSKQEAEINSTGSESANDDFSFTIDYHLSDEYKHSLSNWTKEKKDLEKLIQAPILVSTIDHLIPATEAIKGGKQIPAMLRLLTSDLVLDEPDDLNLDDLPALCRLVNWAGMLGGRILLSTATMPPAISVTLFQAYQAGWAEYAKANIDDWNQSITCAWFDEFNTQSIQIKDNFKDEHCKFVAKRLENLKKFSDVKRKGEIVEIETTGQSSAERLANTIHTNIIKLHKHHKITHNEKSISIGLVRMANINPMVATAKKLFKKGAPEKTSIHYCIYHSRYPLAIRSEIENRLDKILKRNNENEVFNNKFIKNSLNKYPEIKNHIFVIVASPVAEVGRDHDYDWAIVEPSSMRSIIQLAGRVLRHRDKIPTTPNVILLNQNYKSLEGKEFCFVKPGFEIKDIEIHSYQLKQILNKEQYEQIDASQRIVLPQAYNKSNGKYLNLVELEHKAMAVKLFSGEQRAKLWWEKNPTWCGEMQRQQQFRKSQKDEAYYLFCADQDYKWQYKNENVYPAKFGIPIINISNEEFDDFAENTNFFFNIDPVKIYKTLEKDFEKSLKEISETYGEVRLIANKHISEEYKFDPNLGLYQLIGDS